MFTYFLQKLTACADKLVWFSRTFGHQAWFIFLVVFSLTATVMLPRAAFSQTGFSDIQGNWAQPCIQKLAQGGIISGYPDGSFKPNASVTRAEFAAIISKAFPNAPIVRSGGQFSDVSGTYWAREAIRKAYQTGFISGYPGNKFQPSEKIVRSQVLVSLANGLKFTPTQPVGSTLAGAYRDAAAIPDYGRNAIAAATEKQLVVNYPNVQVLNPQTNATRADIASFLCQSTGNIGLVPSQYIATVGNNPTQTTELRGVWLTNIDSDVLFTPNKLTAALQRLDELNFNTIYPTVWNWGYTLYPSAVAERETGVAARIVTPLDSNLDPNLGVKNRDMLREITQEGHQKGLKVIPWFEFGFMLPANSEIAQKHPDWITKKSNGTTIWKDGNDDRVWLNPFKPESQQFIQDLILEIISNYDVDGIQLDDHFGLPSDYGYDPFTVQLYKQEHQGKSPPIDQKNAEWVRWRANKITAFLTKLFQAIKQRQSNLVISLSPNPQRFSYEFFLANWADWERRGLVEELIVQIYRDSFTIFTSELDQPEVIAAKNHIPVGIGILSGLKNKRISLSQIQSQVDAVRKRGFAGVSFFYYETLWNNAPETPTQRQTALERLFLLPAERPELLAGWKPGN